MKLQHLGTVAAVLFATVATLCPGDADAQTQGNFGLYLNPIAIRVSNSVADTGPFAFLGQNSKSQVFFGYNLGGLWDFYHAGSLAAGVDMRFSDLHANNAMLRNFLVGVRVSGQPFTRSFKPYLEAAIGDGSTKAPNSTVHVTKLNYGVFGGVDYPLARHLDLRAIEVGYGTLTTVSSATVGAGGNVAIPASTMLHFSSGLMIRF